MSNLIRRLDRTAKLKLFHLVCSLVLLSPEEKYYIRCKTKDVERFVPDILQDFSLIGLIRILDNNCFQTTCLLENILYEEPKI